MSETPENGVPDELCVKCLAPNMPGVLFCVDCGAPLGMMSTIDPIHRTLAEGFAIRNAVEGPPKLIILVGIWLIMAPLLVSGLGMFVIGNPWSTVLAVPVSAVAVVILFRATKNYWVKRRAAVG
ncbi:MAG: hypothetical protein V4733_05350 [Verrucomicrobiota bacterium]